MLKGSEKQIKWAEDIKSNLIRVYNGVAAANPADADQCKAAIDKLEQVERAGLIIDMYNVCDFNGDLMHDFVQLASAHRTATKEMLSIFLPTTTRR